jgi:hypothetical protein
LGSIWQQQQQQQQQQKCLFTVNRVSESQPGNCMLLVPQSHFTE